MKMHAAWNKIDNAEHTNVNADKCRLGMPSRKREGTYAICTAIIKVCLLPFFSSNTTTSLKGSEHLCFQPFLYASAFLIKLDINPSCKLSYLHLT